MLGQQRGPLIQVGDLGKYQGEATVAPAIGASKKQATVVSDGGRLRDAAGEEREKPRRSCLLARRATTPNSATRMLMFRAL